MKNLSSNIPVFKNEKAGSLPEGLHYSEEKEFSTEPYIEKQIVLLDKSGLTVGQIQFRYPNEADLERLLRIKSVSIEDEQKDSYKGDNLGISMYEKLITIAEEKGFNGIRSDHQVGGGALGVWKKLIDKGYQVEVSEKVKEEWEDFLYFYNNKKRFNKDISVPAGESVFKLSINH